MPLLKGRWKRQIHLHVHRLLEVNEYSTSPWYYFSSPLGVGNAVRLSVTNVGGSVASFNYAVITSAVCQRLVGSSDFLKDLLIGSSPNVLLWVLVALCQKGFNRALSWVEIKPASKGRNDPASGSRIRPHEKRGIFLSNKPDINELGRACLEEKCQLTQILVAGSFRPLLAGL
jgi:hypothetical protein